MKGSLKNNSNKARVLLVTIFSPSFLLFCIDNNERAPFMKAWSSWTLNLFLLLVFLLSCFLRITCLLKTSLYTIKTIKWRILQFSGSSRKRRVLDQEGEVLTWYIMPHSPVPFCVLSKPIRASLAPKTVF